MLFSWKTLLCNHKNAEAEYMLKDDAFISTSARYGNFSVTKPVVCRLFKRNIQSESENARRYQEKRNSNSTRKSRST